jgi:hypothetical protein
MKKQYVPAKVRLQHNVIFVTQILPALVDIAQSFEKTGYQFDLKALVLTVGKDLEIDWVEDIFKTQ